MIIDLQGYLIKRLGTLAADIEGSTKRHPAFAEVYNDLRSSIAWLEEEPGSEAAIHNGRWLVRNFANEIAWQLAR